MNSILAKMAVQIQANTAGFDKAMMKSSQAVQKFSIESELSNTKVGGLAKTIAGFASPVTATIAAVTGLAAAYATSTIGAKDLEFAHNQLTSAITIASNAFAGLISGVEDGEGIVSIFTNALLNKVAPALAAMSFAAAKAQEDLEDLRRNEIIGRAESDELLADNLEKITLIKEGTASYNEKIHQTGEILSNINKAEDGVLKTLNAQLVAKRVQLGMDKENEKLKDEEALLVLEISRETKKYERLRQQILRIESDITEQHNKQNKLQAASTVKAASPWGNILKWGVGDESGMTAMLNNVIKTAVSRLPDLSQPFISTAKEMINISGLVVGGIADIANAFGDAATGSVNFGDAILRSLAGFAQQFGALLIATGIGEIAFKKFSGPQMILAGAALVALGGAVRGAISNRPSLGGAGGGSGNFANISNPYSLYNDNGGRTPTLVLEARGATMIAVTNEQERRDNRIRANSRRLS